MFNCFLAIVTDLLQSVLVINVSELSEIIYFRKKTDNNGCMIGRLDPSTSIDAMPTVLNISNCGSVRGQALDDRRKSENPHLIIGQRIVGRAEDGGFSAEGQIIGMINSEILLAKMLATLSTSPTIKTKIRVENAQNYEGQSMNKQFFSRKRHDGLPGLKLHQQLGGLIRALSSPLRSPGTFQDVMNTSYLHTGSAFFVNNNLVLNEQFSRALVDFYDTKLIPINFSGNPVESQARINEWGSIETGGLIRNFLQYPPEPDTAVVQAVAVHFRGAWETPFYPEATIPGEFMKSENTTVPVSFMRGTLEEAPYAESQRLGLRLLAMPYSGTECAMYVILPTENNPQKYRVGNLASQLSGKDIADLIGLAKRRTVNVMFPKLSLTSSLSLTKALKEHTEYMTEESKITNITVTQATTKPDSIDAVQTSTVPTETGSRTSTVTSSTSRHASTNGPLGRPFQREFIPHNIPVSNNEVRRVVSDDVDRIVFQARMKIENDSIPVQGEDDTQKPQSPPVSKPSIILNDGADNSRFRVSDVIQQIVLEVNEAGTEAAAIAGSTINYSGDVKNFKVNRPFLFFIRQEQTNAFLFWGSIVDPSA